MSKKGPRQRKGPKQYEWGRDLISFASPQAQKALVEAIKIYEQHDPYEIQGDHELAGKLREEAHGLIEEAVSGFIEKLDTNYIRPDRTLRVSPDIILAKITTALSKKYSGVREEMVGAVSCDNFVINELISRLRSYLIVVLMLKEREHRQSPRKDLQTFFFGHDDPHVRQELAGNLQMDELMRTVDLVKGIIIPLFQNKEGLVRVSEDPAITERSRVVFDAISAKRHTTVPLCAIESIDLFKDDSGMVLQFSPTEGSDLSTMYFAQANYYPESFGIQSRIDAMEALSTQAVDLAKGGQMNVAVSIGKVPMLFVDKRTGHLATMMIGTEALQEASRGTRVYDEIRQDVLINLAQLVCRARDLPQEIFEVPVKREAITTETSEDPKSTNGSNARKRTYPESVDPSSLTGRLEASLSDDASELVGATRESVVETEAETHAGNGRVGHTRMLPLSRKTNISDDGEVSIILTSFRPSKEAVAASKVVLRRGLEIINPKSGKTVEVFKPDEAESLARDLGVSTLEEVVELDPKKVHIRFETWVKPTKRSDEAADAPGVIARVRSNIVENS